MSITETRSNTLAEARSRVLKCFNAKRPVFLWGPPGVGKSELISGITEELGGAMIDLRLGQMEPTDIRGIPFYNKDLGIMDWAPPIDLPSEEMAQQYPIIVLFLDEMNSAAPAVQAAGYQLILNRRIGKYVLPDNVVIVAAGNRDSDKGVTYRMPSPLANRFVHLEIRPDFESWQQWAVENTIHQDVIGYLSFAKQDLFDFDAKSASRSFATPRSWSFVSQFLQDEDITDQELVDLVAGTVGEGLAHKFMAHRKVAGKMPNPSDVIEGKVKKLEIEEVSAMYSLTVAMCYELKDRLAAIPKDKPEEMNKWHEYANNFFQFMMDSFKTEVVVMGARVAIVSYKLPMVANKMPAFTEFHKRFGKFIMSAAGR